eukprot:TRINITY_DN10846_c0_g1_i1.p1 TRINITY_DN10846_c0_g1~~TRINITY_DN10846_c0_g1_i1.p1  ORF type:complete len:336 (-),score=68.61 TRINITY_DN10846_c0_g1_i1:36-1043(-)
MFNQCLPYELQLKIFSYLSPVDLANAALVCRDFEGLSNDPLLWRWMFENEKTKWEVVGNSNRLGREDIWSAFLQDIHDLFLEIDQNSEDVNENEEDDENDESSGSKRSMQSPSSPSMINWKYLYLENYRLNTKTSIAKKRTYQKALVIQNPNKHLKIGPTSDPYRVPMFGNGLETGAKKLLYQMMWDEKFPFPVAALYPGVEGFGSGVGFEVNKKLLNIAALHKYEVSLDGPSRASWADYFRSAHGFVFVMDNIRDDPLLKHTVQDLKLLIDDMGYGPLVVFACQIEGKESYSSFELSTILELHQLKGRSWCVRCTSPTDMSTISIGIEWLAQQL